jgi:hypothetical protein
MGNALEKAKQEQVIALGRLGWSPRQIEAASLAYVSEVTSTKFSKCDRPVR